jgi:hypothetical protein
MPIVVVDTYTAWNPKTIGKSPPRKKKEAKKELCYIPIIERIKN